MKHRHSSIDRNRHGHSSRTDGGHMFYEEKHVRFAGADGKRLEDGVYWKAFRENVANVLDPKLDKFSRKIKEDVLESSRFRKVQRDSSKAREDVYQQAKKMKKLEAENRNLKDGIARLGDRMKTLERRNHSVSGRREEDMRPSQRSSSSRGTTESRHRPDRKKEGELVPKQEEERSTGRGTRRERSREEPQPGPSGVYTTRFTRDGRGVRNRRDEDMEHDPDATWTGTRTWHTRRPRGPGDPPLKKDADEKKAKPRKIGPISAAKKQQSGVSGRKTWTYGTKEMAINAVEELIKAGMDSEEAIYLVVHDNRETLDGANEKHLYTWYAKRKEIRQLLLKYPHVRDQKSFKGSAFKYAQK